jgi:hypothetical protein
VEPPQLKSIPRSKMEDNVVRSTKRKEKSKKNSNVIDASFSAFLGIMI